MKIYSKTGDDGTTALIGGTRVAKHHLRIESYGTVDELNSWIGLINDHAIDDNSKKILSWVQDRLFTIGAILATDPEKAVLKNGKNRLEINTITLSDIHRLEQEMDAMDEKLPPLSHFILPGGHVTVSHCHIARTVCRRAERLATHIYEHAPYDKNVLIYLNRLSDYLFVLARKLLYDLQIDEIKWVPVKKDQ